jgi:hypothetical protein
LDRAAIFNIPLNLLKPLDIFQSINEYDCISDKESGECRDGFWKELEESVWNSDMCLGHTGDSEFLRRDNREDGDICDCECHKEPEVKEEPDSDDDACTWEEEPAC